MKPNFQGKPNYGISNLNEYMNKFFLNPINNTSLMHSSCCRSTRGTFYVHYYLKINNKPYYLISRKYKFVKFQTK